MAVGLLGSLLLAAHGPWSASAAQRLEVAIDGVVLPVSVDDLGQWVRSRGQQRSELATWLSLLTPDSRDGVLTLLNAPVLTRRSFGQQMLRSWAAGPLLDALSSLIRVDPDAPSASELVLQTLERLLADREVITTLDVLEALPVDRLRLDLDALVLAGKGWQRSIELQQRLTNALSRQPTTPQPVAAPPDRLDRQRVRFSTVRLPTDHRERDLTLQIWLPRLSSRSTWVLVMPGLGGDPEHFHWLADGLSRSGWPVAMLEHPGSDSRAIQELLEGRQAFDGAVALDQRLLDLQEALAAQGRGDLPVSGERVVLIGHSLGALTALLAMGAQPSRDLSRICDMALRELPLTNLSLLIQCELADGDVLRPIPLPDQPEAVVALNSFGSLLWPQSLAPSTSAVPLMVLGGTLDLITPPIDEQLSLLASLGRHPSSRALIVEGASHFSAIRIASPSDAEGAEDLFQLGEELVGVQPEKVQRVVLTEVVRFLDQVETHQAAGESLHGRSDRIRWHRLNRPDSLELLKGLQ